MNQRANEVIQQQQNNPEEGRTNEIEEKQMSCRDCIGTWDFINFLEYFERLPCCFLFYLLIIVSLCMIFSSLFYGLFEDQNLNYINNLQLLDSISEWNQGNKTSTFSRYEIALEVRDRNFYVDLIELNKDPKYNLSRGSKTNNSLLDNLVWISQGSNKTLFNRTSNYSPFLYYFDVATNTREIFKSILGHLDFNQYEVPLGPSESICGGLKFKPKPQQAATPYELEPPPISLLNLTFCSSFSSLANPRDSGFRIEPWREKKLILIDCVTEEGEEMVDIDKSLNQETASCYDLCRANKGILVIEGGLPVCYQYDVLREICLKVAERNGSLILKGGCYRNDEIAIYKPAMPGRYHNFDDFQLFLREEKDPFLTAVKIGSIEKPYTFSKAQFPEISYMLVRSGMTLVLLLNLFYIGIKLHHKRKYQVLEEDIEK